MNTIEVSNCCPVCSGNSYSWISKTKKVVRCERCGYIAPITCFDSLDQHREYLESFDLGHGISTAWNTKDDAPKVHEPLLTMVKNKRY